MFLYWRKDFCGAPLEGELKVTFKVTPEEFEELSMRNGFIPAPYLARNKWVTLTDVTVLKRKELEDHIKRSYEIIKAKLPKKALK